MINRKMYLTKNQDELIKHNVVMYGAGTQSTGMILMALNGKFDCVPEFAVFADVGAEPDHVLEYKEYFSEYVLNNFGFEIKTVQYKNLDHEIKAYIKGNKSRVSQIPFYTETGMVMRQCTLDYKINPADKYIKKIFEIKRKNKEQKGTIALWMGISKDEIQRMKKSSQWWKVLIYPLIEKGYRRIDTIKYVKKHGLKEPPRSACYFCPFHSNEYWKYLYENYPDEYQKAIEFDEEIRNYPKMKQKMFIHKSRKPLYSIDYTQMSFMDLLDECDGYCGI